MPPPTIHSITDVSAYVGVLQRAEAAGLHVRLGVDGKTLEVSDMPVLKGGKPSPEMQREQKAVSGRLDELIRQQMWSAFYGTSRNANAPSLQKREAKHEVNPTDPSRAMGKSTVLSAAGVQGLAYKLAGQDNSQFRAELKQALQDLRQMAEQAKLSILDSFAQDALQDLADERIPMHERLRMMAERVPEIINEFGYLGSTSGGGDRRFLEMMDKLAHALSLAAGPLEEALQDSEVSAQQRKHQFSAQIDKARSERAQSLNKQEAARLIATQEGRQILEQHLQQALHAAREVVRQSNPTRPDEAVALHNNLGRVEDRLLTPRPGEHDASRWEAAIDIAQEHQEALERQAAKNADGPSDKSSAVSSLMERLTEVRQLLGKWNSRSQTEGDKPTAPGEAKDRKASTAANDKPLTTAEHVSSGVKRDEPGWSESASRAAHVRTGSEVRMTLEVLAKQTLRSMMDNMVQMAGVVAAGGGQAAAMGQLFIKERCDRSRALMAALAVAISEIQYTYRDSSRERLRAACSHIVPHLGNIDSLIGMAAALDDHESVQQLFRMRKCLVSAHGNVQPSYLSFQAVPLPPEIFREIGRSMGAAAMGGKGTTSLLPEEMGIAELLKASGEIIERVVRQLLEILEKANGAAAAHRAGPVLQLVLDTMGDSETGISDKSQLTLGLLMAIQPELQMALDHSEDPLERQQLQAVLSGLVNLQNVLYPSKA
jgi:hypothetical protein